MYKTIKILVATVCAMATLSLVGCSKDPEDLIIGTWYAQKIVTTTTVSGMGEEYDGTTTDTETFKEGEAGFTFKEDGTVLILTLDEETGKTDTETANYTISDKTLTISDGDESQTMTIASIDKKEMHLSATLNMPVPAGATASSTTDMYFKKK